MHEAFAFEPDLELPVKPQLFEAEKVAQAAKIHDEILGTLGLRPEELQRLEVVEKFIAPPVATTETEVALIEDAPPLSLPTERIIETRAAAVEFVEVPAEEPSESLIVPTVEEREVPVVTAPEAPTIIFEAREDLAIVEPAVETDATEVIQTPSIEAVALPQPNEETMDTYHQLTELINAERDEQPVFWENEIIELRVEDDSQAVANPFAEYVTAMPQPEEPLELEAIQAQAEDQPLEETLAQLAVYMEAVEMPEDSPIVELLNEIHEELTALMADLDKESLEPVLTPELTEKFLDLLREVGYEEPQKVLVEFVEKHGFEFLVQAVDHLYKLSDDRNNPEFLSFKSGMSSVATDESIPARLGRAILNLIKANNRLPALNRV